MAATEGLGEGTLDQVVVMPFNETAVAREILESHKDELAGVIIEPMLGSVGMLPATPEFLTMLREFTKANGIILIFDEVISYRAASGGAQEYYGITPDMTSLGKIIGGGFSIGAFGGSKAIMDLYDPTVAGGPRVAHAGTFNANPVTMLAGAATLEELTPEVYRKLAEMTEYLRAGVLQVGADLETPVQVTGLGSLFGLHFTGQELIGYRDIAAEDSAFRHQVFLGLLNEGILMAANLVGAVSTEIGEKEIDAFTAALRRVLERALTPSG
jgi:glutamate-1-semialdehyde 2,1-aminomutase